MKRLGRRLLEVIDPEAADAHEAKLLETRGTRRQAACRLTMWEDGHGKVHGRFTLDALTGAMLKKALLALAAPKHQAATQGPLGERRPTPERLGRAFTELIQRYPTNRLPKAGGVNATVVVTMTLESLLGGLKAAQLDTGQTISAVPARRLACEAGIIPAVLGGQSQVLDLGRKRRFHTGPSGSPRPSSNAAAPPRAATGHPGCATCTTRSPGAEAAGPTATASCSAPSTTPAPTTPRSPLTKLPAGRSPSTDGPEPTAPGDESGRPDPACVRAAAGRPARARFDGGSTSTAR